MSAEIIKFPSRGIQERYLNTDEVAEILGVSRRWVGYKARAGMPSYRVGRMRRFKLSEVEAWLQEKSA